MQESSISLEPKVSARATLRQAVEWVALDLPPLIPVYDQAFRDPSLVKVTEFVEEETTQAFSTAKERLFVALVEGHLPAWASCVVENQRYYVEDVAGSRFREVDCDKKWQGVKADQWENIEMDWYMNCISYAVPQPGAVNSWERQKLYIAKGISVETKRLFELFPERKQETTRSSADTLKRYSTPYIDLMIRAIDELKISRDHQPVKKEIERWLLKADPSLSERDFRALATFLRLPERRKGGTQKKKRQ